MIRLCAMLRSAGLDVLQAPGNAVTGTSTRESPQC